MVHAQLGTSSGILVIEVAGQTCGIPLTVIEEVIAMPQLSRPAGMPSILGGFMNLGGEPVAVLKMSRLLGTPHELADLYTPLVIIRHEQTLFGLEVSAVRGVVAITPEQIHPLADQHTACGTVNLDGQVVAILDVSGLLLEKERQRIDELRIAMEQRMDDLARTETHSC